MQHRLAPGIFAQVIRAHGQHGAATVSGRDRRSGGNAVVERHHGAHQLADHQRRHMHLAQPNDGRAAVALAGVQLGNGLAVGLLQLPVEDAPVVGRQVDARLDRVARHLAQAAGGRLQDEVVAALQLAGQGAREQRGHVPAFHPAVHQQGNAAGRVTGLEAVELGLVFLVGVVLQDEGR